MLKMLLIFCTISCIAAENFDLEKISIPNTGYNINAPKEWHECIKKENILILCGNNILPNLTIIKHLNNTAKNIYQNAINSTNNYDKIYGNRMFNKAYWLDYEASKQKQRIFSVFKDIEDGSVIEVTYRLINMRISGYIMARYQASLLSLSK